VHRPEDASIILVRGVGDIGSAVAHRLFREGYGVVIHDDPKPTMTRRGGLSLTLTSDVDPEEAFRM